MIVIRPGYITGLSGTKTPILSRRLALALGKFESIHIGHQALISKLSIESKKAGLAAALFVFDPHPYRVLGQCSYRPLFTSGERERLLADFGIDYLIEYPFDNTLMSMSPEDFCTKLIDQFFVKIILVGEGYRFGYRRTGTVDLLKYIAGKKGVEVQIIKPRTDIAFSIQSDGLARGQKSLPDILPPRQTTELNGKRYSNFAGKISTSDIRTRLLENDFKKAAGLLGFPFFVEGVCDRRETSGALNSKLVIYPSNEKFLPAKGVYLSRAILDGRKYMGVTKIGYVPRVNESCKVCGSLVETYLPDFDCQKMRSWYIRVEFLDSV